MSTMTSKDLKNIQQLLNAAGTSNRPLTVEELDHLRLAVSMDLHEAEVTEYIDYLDSLVATDETMKHSYDLTFEIICDGHSLRIPFSATPYNGIVDMLKEYRDNEL